VSDLLAGEIKSQATRPIEALADMARTVRANPAWHAAFGGSSPEKLHALITSDDAWRPLREMLEGYLEAYGDRFAGELSLEEPSLRESPTWALAMLKVHTEAQADPEVRRAGESERRRAAEAKVASRLSWPRRLSFSLCLAAARRFIGYRETMRFDRSRLFGLVRDIVRRLGEALFAAGLTAAPDDVYYLTLDEALGAVEGISPGRDIERIAAARRREQERDRDLPPPPDRFFTLGAAHAWFPLVPSAAARPSGTDQPLGADELAGVGCSPGVVTAEAQVVRDPRDPGLLAGKILVARANDPGWVPLYAGIAGLLLERGSPLSHAANVARELCIPAILGIPGLLERVRTGQRLTLDASRGRVKILG
jgi:pyruvate,water dikinase